MMMQKKQIFEKTKQSLEPHSDMTWILEIPKNLK